MSVKHFEEKLRYVLILILSEIAYINYGEQYTY
jgi:hypothetical protein